MWLRPLNAICPTQAMGGSVTALRQTIRNGARNLNNVRDDEYTLRLLLQGGVNPNAPIHDDAVEEAVGQPIPPLAYALVWERDAQWRQPGLMRALLEAGADPNPTFEWEGRPTRLLDLAIEQDYEALLLPELIPRLHLGGLPAPALQALLERLLEG